MELTIIYFVTDSIIFELIIKIYKTNGIVNMKIMFVYDLLKNKNIFIIYSYTTVGTIMPSTVMHLFTCGTNNARYQTL